MIASDIMVTRVASVKPDATVAEVAATLARRRISGAPVIDDAGRIVGMVSEGDLMRRAEIGTERRSTWWLELFSSSDGLAAEFVRSHSRKVADVMTRDVIAVSEETPIADIASLLERKRIKRVPVMKDGQVVGIVSRANLVQALACSPRIDSQAEDRALRARIMADLDRQPWSPNWTTNVTVTDGVAELWGATASDQQRRALGVLVENVPGVREVEDHTFPMPVATD